MKRIIYSCFLFVALILTKSSFSQVFWTETFGSGCNGGQLAAGTIATPTNGAWAVTVLATAPGNGATANEWFISATENGNAIGACGSGCGTNRTLHVGSNLVPFLIDPGAAYLAGAGANTNKRVESPVINCTGSNNISLSMKYLTRGVAAIDFAQALYFDGAVWNTLGTMAITSASCLPQGAWSPYSIALPASANNNPNVKIGFGWQNNDPTGADPSIAVDDITLSKVSALTITTAVTACVNQTVNASVTATLAGATSYTWVSSPAGAIFAPTTGTSTTITYTAAGTYSIACVGLNPLPVGSSNTIIVNVAASPIILVAPPSQTICAGGTATITASGATTYTWSTAATTSVITSSPAASTNFTVVGSANGCNAAASASVVIGANLSITAGASSPSVCPGSAVTLTASGAK